MNRSILQNLHHFKGISRTKTGWNVRLKYVDGKPTIQQYFSDSKYGGLAKSGKAACMFRNCVDDSQSLRLKWKDRTSQVMKMIQSKYEKQRINVGKGIEAARIAYEHGMSRVTCYKIRTGKQDFFTVNNGGWRTDLDD